MTNFVKTNSFELAGKEGLLMAMKCKKKKVFLSIREVELQHRAVLMKFVDISISIYHVCGNHRIKMLLTLNQQWAGGMNINQILFSL